MSTFGFGCYNGQERKFRVLRCFMVLGKEHKQSCQFALKNIRTWGNLQTLDQACRFMHFEGSDHFESIGA